MKILRYIRIYILSLFSELEKNGYQRAKYLYETIFRLEENLKLREEWLTKNLIHAENILNNNKCSCSDFLYTRGMHKFFKFELSKILNCNIILGEDNVRT